MFISIHKSFLPSIVLGSSPPPALYSRAVKNPQDSFKHSFKICVLSLHLGRHLGLEIWNAFKKLFCSCYRLFPFAIFKRRPFHSTVKPAFCSEPLAFTTQKSVSQIIFYGLVVDVSIILQKTASRRTQRAFPSLDRLSLVLFLGEQEITRYARKLMASLPFLVFMYKTKNRFSYIISWLSRNGVQLEM